MQEITCKELEIILKNKPSAFLCGNGFSINFDLKDCKNLEYINISYNYLNNLDFKNFDSIKTIRCGSNNIRRIDLTGCFSLTTLECDNNNLQKLDISDCQNIDKLIFGGNQITDENFKMNENATLSLLSNGENLLQHIVVKASDGNLYSVTCSGNGSVGMFLNTGKYKDYMEGVRAYSYGFDKDSIYKGWNIDNCNPDKYNDELDMIENNLTEVSTAFLQRDISDSSIIENLANKVDNDQHIVRAIMIELAKRVKYNAKIIYCYFSEEDKNTFNEQYNHSITFGEELSEQVKEIELLYIKTQDLLHKYFYK